MALGVDRDASVGQLEGPADHRHAPLPAQRRAPALRRLAQQHVRPPRPRRHSRRRPRDPDDVEAPQLHAGAARAVGVVAVRRGRRHRAALGAHRDLHAHVPALRRARTSSTRGASGRTTSASSTKPARSPSTRRSGGASARTSRSRPSRCGSATRSRRSTRVRRSRRSSTRSPAGSLARSTTASRSPINRTG